MDHEIIERFEDALRTGRRHIVNVDLREALLAARSETRDLSTSADPGQDLVSGPLVEAVALSAVGAGSWIFDPIYGPKIVNVATGEERRIVGVTPPGMIGGGVVTALTLGAGGSGYTTPPLVTFTGASGSGASAEAVLAAGGIASIAVTNGGSGYRSIPGVTISGGGTNPTGTRFSVLLTPSSVTRIDVTAGGSGYTAATTSGTISGGGGSGARIREVEVTSGRVTHVVLDAVGSGYTSPPSITITDSGGGTGATAVALLRATSVASVTVTAAGSGYTEIPDISFTGGQGSGATATATLTARAVASFNLLSGGGGYSAAPTVTISGGGGSGATATATITVQRAVAEGRPTLEAPPVFDSRTLSFQTLRPLVHVSRELLQDAELVQAIVAESFGLSIASSIEQHLLYDSADGIFENANHPNRATEPTIGTRNFNANAIGGINSEEWYELLLDGLHALPDYARADKRCRWLFSPQWRDGATIIAWDTSSPTTLGDPMSPPWGVFGIPELLVGHGRAEPASNADDLMRFGAVGVWPLAALIALVGQAELMIDPYGLANQGEVRITLRQRYAATRWNSTWYSTMRGPTFR